MKPDKHDDAFGAFLHSLLMQSILSQSGTVYKIEKSPVVKTDNDLSPETTQVMKEIEHFNLMNLIDKALDERDEETFMRLTGELLHA